MAAFSTLVLAVGGAGAYLAASLFSSAASNNAVTVADASAPGYVSPLDETCGRGWTEGMRNGRQLKCYLTTSPDRLCNKQEKAHLVAVMRRYAKDEWAWNAKFAKAGARSLMAMQNEWMKLGYASAQMQRDTKDGKWDEASFKEVTSITAGIMDEPNTMMEEAKDSVPHYQLVNLVKELIVKGYLTREAFGEDRVRLFEQAYREALDQKRELSSACR